MFTEQKKGISPTLQQCIDVGITLAIPEYQSVIWYEQYAPQGFYFSSGVPMVDLKLAMQRHKNNGTLAGLVEKASKVQTQEKQQAKQKLEHQEKRRQVREQYQPWLEGKTTQALKDIKRDKGRIAYMCSWLIDEIIAKRKSKGAI